MKFHLRVYDNFHYMDESEAYNFGEYETYEEAVIAAQEIIHEFLEHNWKPGIMPHDLSALFALYGEDPIILPNELAPEQRFSARTYVATIVTAFCEKMEKKLK